MNERLSYAKTGVNIDTIKKTHKEIEKMIQKTYHFRSGKFGDVILGAGHYAGLIDIGGGKRLALHADGVGTKTMIAEAMKKYDTVGVDCVAMNVNDLICLGAEPLALVDYLAIDKPEQHKITEITKGLVQGAEEAGVSIIGGETAVIPDLINGFDLAAMSSGVVDKEQIVTGEQIKVGDIIIGIGSSGIHSNGLTLARKALIPKLGLHTYITQLEGSVGAELLKPTQIYVKLVLKILKNCDVHGLAHITGGAFTKLIRLNSKRGYKIDNLPEPHPIFHLIQKYGQIEEREDCSRSKSQNPCPGWKGENQQGKCGEDRHCVQERCHSCH